VIPDIRIKYNGVNVRLVGFGFKKFHHLRILETGLESLKERLSAGIGEEDGAPRPLKKRYARWKSKVLRKRAVRDLTLTGALLKELLPRYADDNIASADASTRDGRKKLRSKYNRESFQWSPKNQKDMLDRAGELFTEGVEQTVRFGKNLPRAAAFSRQTKFNRTSYFGRAA
jgi:hypothetical protein